MASVDPGADSLGAERVCPLCGRRVRGVGEAPGKCPSCGVALPSEQAPALERVAAISAMTPLVESALPAGGAGIAVDKGSISDDDSATRPVAPELIPTVVLAPASSLAPADATTTDSNLIDVATATLTRPAGPADASTQELPPVSPQEPPRDEGGNRGTGGDDGRRGGGGGGGGGRGDGGGGERGNDAKRDARGRMAATLALVVLLLLVATGVVLWSSGVFGSPAAAPAVTPSPAATNTATTAVGKLFSVPGYYSMIFPPTWNSNPITRASADDLSNINYYGPNGANLDVNIFTAGAAGYAATPQDADTQALTAFNGGTPIQPTAQTAVTIDGAAFTADAADVTLNGQHLHAVALATVRGGNMYLISYAAPADTFSSEQTTFQSILDSFKFLS